MTSSPVLASRDVEQSKGFYKLFGLEVAGNEDNGDSDGVKSCYLPSIDAVYGDIDNFEFDWLRHHYSKLNTRGKRKCEAVIIDEVDNFTDR